MLGTTVTLTDFGHWTEMKAKYPEAAAKVLPTLPEGLSESKLGRTWVFTDDKGEHWLAGKSGMKMFYSRVENLDSGGGERLFRGKPLDYDIVSLLPPSEVHLTLFLNHLVLPVLSLIEKLQTLEYS